MGNEQPQEGCVDLEELEEHHDFIRLIKKETLDYEREELLELFNAYVHDLRRAGRRCDSEGIRLAIEIVRDRYDSGLIV